MSLEKKRLFLRFFYTESEKEIQRKYVENEMRGPKRADNLVCMEEAFF